MTWREKYRQDPDLAESIITTLRSDLDEAEVRVKKLEYALEHIRNCASSAYYKGEWITTAESMDAVRAIAREALEL